MAGRGRTWRQRPCRTCPRTRRPASPTWARDLLAEAAPRREERNAGEIALLHRPEAGKHHRVRRFESAQPSARTRLETRKRSRNGRNDTDAALHSLNMTFLGGTRPKTRKRTETQTEQFLLVDSSKRYQHPHLDACSSFCFDFAPQRLGLVGMSFLGARKPAQR